jgi:hypothetical protein
MAEVVAAWPLEATGVVESPPAAADSGSVRAPADLAAAAADEERELWRTSDARLTVRRDARTARNVLIEERAEPLEDAALERLRHIAAAGGPLVQRVLRLSEDRRAVWYEAIAGEPVPLDELSDEERRPLAAAIASLPAGAARFVARTSTGPVVLIASDRPPA